MPDSEISRRKFLTASALATGIAAIDSGSETAIAAKPSNDAFAFHGNVDCQISVNGLAHRVHVDAHVSLLDFLRERLQLTGTKKGCNHGECGACTVHLDGRRVNSCMVLAVQADSQEVTTIEGLAKDGGLHAVQQAFIDHDAFQCGFCTPGQIMSAVACIKEGHIGSDAEIREWMSGNLCRCSAYPQIVDAVKAAAAVG